MPRRTLSGITLASIAGLASAGIVTVTTVEDVVDAGGGNPTIAQLPGPDGRVSFREALLAIDNTPGPDTIEFAIPQSEWWLVTEMAILRQEYTWSLQSDGNTIDYSSQARFTGNTNPNGNELGVYGLEPNAWGVASLFVMGDNNTFIGLGNVWQRGYALEFRGNHNRVIGCVIDGPLHAAIAVDGGWGGPPTTGTIIGGTGPGEGNRLTSGGSGVRVVHPSDQTQIIGNQLIGSRHAGVDILGNIYTGRPDKRDHLGQLDRRQRLVRLRGLPGRRPDRAAHGRRRAR
jgi:hypothetical protein